MKSKTWAAWLALLGGPLALDRLYLYGARDAWGWLLRLPGLAGLVGLARLRWIGLEDLWGAVLLPLLGVTVAAAALCAIVHGLTPPTRWNARYNRHAAADASAGQSQWLTVTAVVLALMVGATVLLGTLVFSAQRYFELQSGSA